VSRWLTTLARRGGTVRDDMARHQAAAAFAGSGGALPLCQQVVQRFPFRPAAREDVSMDDFSQLFAPNGRLDGFFTQFVRPYVDTTAKDWKLRDPASTQAPVTAEAVGQFQRALAIRDTFFAQGGTQPRVSFALRPIALDSAAHQVTLDFGGITASWSQGVSASINIIEWPGPTRMNTVRVSFDPLGTGPALDQTGPWALFRLIAHASLQRTSAGDGYQVTLTQGAREARFELTAASAHSPFDADLFAGFKCPTVRP
jgi:type VI secretion system protein ImpL